MQENSINAVMQRVGISYEEVTRYFKNTPSEVPEFIPLKKSNLPKFVPGMYVYKDGISKRLIPNEPVLTVLLFVKDGLLYCDSFEQRYCLGDKTEEFLKFIATKEEIGCQCVKRGNAEALKQIFSSMAVVNAALRKIKKLVWSEECYWGERLSSTQSKIVEFYEGSERTVSDSYGAYFRPLLVMSLK